MMNTLKADGLNVPSPFVTPQYAIFLTPGSMPIFCLRICQSRYYQISDWEHSLTTFSIWDVLADWHQKKRIRDGVADDGRGSHGGYIVGRKMYLQWQQMLIVCKSRPRNREGSQRSSHPLSRRAPSGLAKVIAVPFRPRQVLGPYWDWEKWN